MGVPLLLKDASGNLQEFTTGEEAYLSYLASLQLLEDSAIGSLNTSGGTSIGSFSNTFFNEPVGTHPSTSITVGTTTSTVYQNLGTALEDSADWRRPLEVFDSAGFAGVKEMDDASLNAAVDRYLSYIFTNDLPGTYLLADSDGPAAPGYTAAVNPVFTDTRTDGYSKNYALWRRTPTLFSIPTTKRALHLKRAGNTQAGVYDDGIEEMTDQEIKTTFGQRAKTRINASGIGKYQLRTSSQGAPTDPGTWVAKGTAIDTRKTTGDVNYDATFVGNYESGFTGTFSSFFEIAYQGNYIGNFVGNYVSNYLTDYLTDYATVYEPAAFTNTFTRNSTTNFTGNFIGNFVGNYVSNFTRNSTTNFTGDFIGNFVGNYSRNFTRDSTSNFTRDSTNTFAAFYQRNFTRDSTLNFQSNFTRNSEVGFQNFFAAYYTIEYEGAGYTRNFVTGYQGDFVGNFVGNYVRFIQYAGNYVRLITYSRNFFGNYARNFTRDSVASFAGGGGGTVVPNATSYTGGGNDTDFLSPIGGIEGSSQVVVYQGNTFGNNYLGSTLGLENTYVGIKTSPIPHSGLSTSQEISGYGASFEGPLLYVSVANYIGAAAYQRSGAYDPGYVSAGAAHFMYFNHGHGAGQQDQLSYVGPLVVGGSPDVNYTRNFIGNYLRNFTRDSVGGFNAAPAFVGNYQRSLVFTRDRLANFTRISNQIRPITFVGTYQANYEALYLRNFVLTFVGDFVGDFVGNFIGNYLQDYQRNFTGNFIGDFTGNFVGNYEGAFTRDSTRNSTSVFTGDFTGDYARNFTRDSTRDSTTVFTGDFTGNYTGDFIGTYEQLYTKAYEIGYETDFTRDSTTDFTIPYISNYLGNFEGTYLRNFVLAYETAFAGETILNFNQTIETYTLYVRIA